MAKTKPTHINDNQLVKGILLICMDMNVYSDGASL